MRGQFQSPPSKLLERENMERAGCKRTGAVCTTRTLSTSRGLISCGRQRRGIARRRPHTLFPALPTFPTRSEATDIGRRIKRKSRFGCNMPLGPLLLAGVRASADNGRRSKYRRAPALSRGCSRKRELEFQSPGPGGSSRTTRGTRTALNRRRQRRT